MDFSRRRWLRNAPGAVFLASILEKVAEVEMALAAPPPGTPTKTPTLTPTATPTRTPADEFEHLLELFKCGFDAAKGDIVYDPNDQNQWEKPIKARLRHIYRKRFLSGLLNGTVNVTELRTQAIAMGVFMAKIQEREEGPGNKPLKHDYLEWAREELGYHFANYTNTTGCSPDALAAGTAPRAAAISMELSLAVAAPPPATRTPTRTPTKPPTRTPTATATNTPTLTPTTPPPPLGTKCSICTTAPA